MSQSCQFIYTWSMCALYFIFFTKFYYLTDYYSLVTLFILLTLENYVVFFKSEQMNLTEM